MSVVGVQKCVKNRFIVRLVSRLFFSDFCIEFSTFLTNRCFRMECTAKIDVSWKSFLVNFGMDFCCLSEALGAVFLTFLALKADLKTEGFL